MRVLVVDDEPAIRTVARLALERVGGHAVALASSGEEAMALVQHELPDVIVLDVMMPGMDGPSTMLAIHELPGASGLPVVFLTAKAQPQEVQRLRELGATGVITKPFDPMTLARQIEAVLRGGE